MAKNKGEWSEPYAALRIIGDGKLYLADNDNKRKANEWMEVLEVIRKETTERIVRYGIDAKNCVVRITVNDEPVRSFLATEFVAAADRLLSEIKGGAIKNLELEREDATPSFLRSAGFERLSASSSDRNDIYLTAKDPRSSVVRQEIGFTIKSKLGSPSTLFNTGRASAAIYELSKVDKSIEKKINEMRDDAGNVSVLDRCQALLGLGCRFRFAGFERAQRAGCEAFRDNLDMINPLLPGTFDWILRNRYLEGDTDWTVPHLVEKLAEENPLGLFRPEVKYEYMLKSFLYAAYGSLKAGSLWDGKNDVNGGFIFIDEDGQVLAHYALEGDEFKQYLYDHCYFDSPATSRGHGDYGYVYQLDGRWWFKLNFQIRYK